MTSPTKALVAIAILGAAACGSEAETPGEPQASSSGGEHGGGGAGGAAGATTDGGAAATGSGGDPSGGTGGEAGAGAGASGGEGGAGGQPIPLPEAAGCITDVSPTDFRQYDCEGLEFNLSIPAACLTEACGLIIDVHGMSMSGQMEDNNTNLAELGRQDGYLVVNPNATPNPPAAAWSSSGADDAKVLSFVEQLLSVFHVDTKRVHITGYSQGGAMSWRFLCDHPDLIASAAPAAFGLSAGTNECFSNGVPPSRPVPILYMHGTRDALINFSNAEEARDAVVSSQQMSHDGMVSSDAEHRWTRYVNDDGALDVFVDGLHAHQKAFGTLILQGFDVVRG